VRQLRQAALGQPDLPLDVCLDDRLFPRRQQFLDRRLLGADKSGEEAALGEKLVARMVRVEFVFSCGLKSSMLSGTARHALTVLFVSLA
jgi:hypothetical protein